MNLLFSVPTATQLRRFLHQQGIRLKRWRAQEEVFESFYRQLAEERHQDVFWERFSELSSELVTELRHLHPDSEFIVEMERQQNTAMDDIRAALSKVRGVPNGFRQLGACLSTVAVSLLIAVSLSVVGCGGAIDEDNQADHYGTGGTGGASSHVGGTTSTSSGKGGSSANALGGTTASAGTGNQMGGVGASCSTSPPAIKDLFDGCGVDPELTGLYLEDLAACDASWGPGLASFLACLTCDQINDYLEMICGTCPKNTPFSVDLMRTYCVPQPMYLVVQTASSVSRRRKRAGSNLP